MFRVQWQKAQGLTLAGNACQAHPVGMAKHKLRLLGMVIHVISSCVWA